MALTILSSNRVETLQSRLSQQLSEQPLSNPFSSEVIVVPTFAMSRWLNLRIAQQQGVAANIEYLQPGKWVWQLAGSMLDEIPQQDPYSVENLTWDIFSLLPELLSRSAFTVLMNYLVDDANGVKRWQLAQRIGSSFDRYQLFRPQTIRAWSSGKDSHWQALLWRKIMLYRNRPHRVETIAALIDRLGNDACSNRLPQRVSLFAISSLAPLYVEVIQALARRIEVQLYLHSPTDQYWAALESEKQKSRKRFANPDEDGLYETRNELLASWGRQGQEFQDLLLDVDSLYSIDIDLFVEPENDSLLGKIQKAIFDLDQGPMQTQADDSISIHICHSAMRECQVLLDQLLAMLDHNREIAAEDILVMVPDIATYAPYIEAVFRHDSQSRLACNISDITTADEHPLVITFLQLLKLPYSRFSMSEIMALLDNESLRRRFDIDDQSLQEIRLMTEQANTRWGIDASHKTALDLPPTRGNTWQQTRDRFFAGFALAGDGLWNDIAPLPGWSESDAGAIGRFWYFFDRLEDWRERLGKTYSAREWQSLLLQLLEDFFVDTDLLESRLQQIRDAINDFHTDSESSISPGLVAYLLQQQLDAREHSGRLYSGGVTFCGMRPMRSVPFKVICLLGMNGDDFPRRDEQNDFELLSTEFIAGDPSKRSEDRYLMLETLLCARNRLYISYTGRSLKDNSPGNASVLVAELLDFIDRQFYSDPINETRFSEQLEQVHAMQVFSTANYQLATGGYNQYWCKVANLLAKQPPGKQQGWSQISIPGPEKEPIIDLEQLRRFICNPVEYFFKARLGIFLDTDEETEDDEAFDLNHLEQWKLKQQLAGDILDPRADGMQRMYAEGILAHGHAAQAQIDLLKLQQHDWLRQLEQYHGCQSRTLPLDLKLENDYSLSGIVGGYYPGKGLMAYHGGNFKGRQLLSLWVDHLMLCASDHAPSAGTSRLLANNETWGIEGITRDQARKQLEDYCALYQEGLQRPLPVFPETSFELARTSDRDKAIAAAYRQWQGQWSQGKGSEAGNGYIQLGLRNITDPPFDEAEFDRYAQRIYAGLLDCSGKL